MQLCGVEGGRAGEGAQGERGGQRTQFQACLYISSLCLSCPSWRALCRSDVLLIMHGALEMSSPGRHVENVSPRWSGGYVCSKHLGASANFSTEWKR